jgi:hypothetical protein
MAVFPGITLVFENSGGEQARFALAQTVLRFSRGAY